VVGVTGDGLFDRVSSGAPLAPDSDSSEADKIIQDGAHSDQTITLQVNGINLADVRVVGEVATILGQARAELAEIDGVAHRASDGYAMVIDPLNPSFATDPALDPLSPEAAMSALGNQAVQGMVAQDRRGLLLTVEIAKDLDDNTKALAVDAVVGRLESTAASLEESVLGANASVGGQSLVLDEIISAMKHDLELGEMIALPVALLVMVLVFAGFLAAAMPVAGAIASILTCMGAVFGFTYVTDIHTSVINVISLIGLGLSIDYGLLVVSRFREEVRRTGPEGRTELPGRDLAVVKRRVRQAVIQTVRTAGKTVFYSALTIAVCVAGLMAFEPSILRTFGLAGLIVVLLALASAITLVPAFLVLLGRYLIQPSPLSRLPGLALLYSKSSDISPDVGVFSKLAAAVQKHPWLVMGGVLVIMGALAWPARGIELRNSTVELLPIDSPQQEFLHDLARDYPGTGSDGITVVSQGNPQATEQFARDHLADIPDTELIVRADGSAAIEMDGYALVILRVEAADNEGPEARAAVRAVRAAELPDFAIHVTGPAAHLLDFEDQLKQGAPKAAIIICLAVFVLLFLFTGSILIPLKALITNALSLLACLGAVTWVFQDGHFEGLLGFNAMNGIESYIVVLLLIFSFGLAMDYEVFLISRIKEAWDQGHDPQGSVRDGLQHSGRIITSAALIIIMVFLGFVAGDLVIIKEMGIGLAVTVALDATLVRMLLVPATMSVLGKWNWWAPKPLVWLHSKLGLTE
jgi:RND superfamily putative drug exporter